MIPRLEEIDSLVADEMHSFQQTIEFGCGNQRHVFGIAAVDIDDFPILRHPVAQARKISPRLGN